MNMIVHLSMYEALTEAGIKPDAARKVEREIESAIQAGQDAVRAEMREQVLSRPEATEMETRLRADIADVETRLRADITGLEIRMHKALTEQTWKLLDFMTVANGIMLAALRFLTR